jgi:hypothetical protein
MLFNAELTHARDKALAIGLPLIADKIRMGRAKHDIDGVGAAFQDRGMASIVTSTPLLGDRRPNVRMTVRPLNPYLAFASSGSTKGKSGIPCGMTSIFSAGAP